MLNSYEMKTIKIMTLEDQIQQRGTKAKRPDLATKRKDFKKCQLIDIYAITDDR